MRIRKGLVLRDVCGVQVIVGEGLDALDFGNLLSLNDSAAFLWKVAVELEDVSVDPLVDALCREYDVEPEQAKLDVIKMIDEWKQAGVFE